MIQIFSNSLGEEELNAVRGVLAVRQVLTALNAVVLPSTVQIAWADQAFDESGRLKDAKSATQVAKACAELLRFTALVKGQDGPR
jgi:NAD(P)H-dependent FMN reductase